MKTLQTLLNQLRASYQVYRNSHWTVGPEDYYGNHLLLQRIYQETEKQIDRLGEMMVGTYGPRSIQDATNRTSYWTARFTVRGDPMKSSLKAAQSVRAGIDKAYAALQSSGEMTHGWDDLLTALADEKDGHLYLLQQATGTPAPRAVGRRSGLRKKNPRGRGARSILRRAMRGT